MTELSPQLNSELSARKASWRDFIEMCKPRVVLLMLLCTLVGMFLATDQGVPVTLIFATLTGVALIAGSAAVVNHLADAHIDSRMARTRNRPMATGRVSELQAMVFSLVIGCAGFTLLYVLVNPLTAWLNLASWIGYGLVYTLFLKRATPQNIVIGGLFGAAPPLFGWTAVTGSMDPGGLLLVLIIFAWTPPHFWALAIDRKADYEKADIPMLPVTHGDRYTRQHIFLYTLVMIAITLLPYSIGMSHLIYLISSLLLGAGFLYWAIKLLIGTDSSAPRKTFHYSIVYLMLLFLALLVDHYLPLGVQQAVPAGLLMSPLNS